MSDSIEPQVAPEAERETRMTPRQAVAEMRIRSGDQIRVQRRGAGWRDLVGLGASMIAAVASVVAAINIIRQG